MTFTDGATILAAEPLSQGNATLTTAGLAVGTHSITATYDGDTSFASSSSADSVKSFDRAATTTTIASSANTSTYGQAASFTATVTGGTRTPTGNVSFADGSTIWEPRHSMAERPPSQAASYLSRTMITASFQGSVDFAKSSPSGLKLSVQEASTTTTLSESANSSVSGQAVTLTAPVPVASSSSTPTGTVTFLDGTTSLGSANLGGEMAELVTSNLAIGTHAIVAVYDGDGRYSGSRSSELSQTVMKDTTTLMISSSSSISAPHQTLTLTATAVATGAGGGMPSGTVTFLNGSKRLGIVTLQAGSARLSTAKPRRELT